MRKLLAAGIIVNLSSAIFNAFMSDSVVSLIIALGNYLIACIAYYSLQKRGI